MATDNLSRVRVVPVPGADTCPVARLLADLTSQWHGESIGPGITDWTARNGRGRMTALRLGRLPERLRVELAWMAHWQYLDGVGVHVAGINQIAAVLADAKDMKRAVPGSSRDLDWDAASRMVSVWFEARRQRLPAPVSLRSLRPLFGYPRLALTARLHEGPWWEMDTWYPRCDPRIPLRDREPCGSVGCAPGAIVVAWLRDAAKWALAMMLQAGVLTWDTIRGDRIQWLLRFDRWLATLPDPAHVVGDLHRAGGLAAAFRQCASDPANRASTLRGRPVVVGAEHPVAVQMDSPPSMRPAGPHRRPVTARPYACFTVARFIRGVPSRSPPPAWQDASPGRTAPGRRGWGGVRRVRIRPARGHLARGSTGTGHNPAGGLRV